MTALAQLGSRLNPSKALQDWFLERVRRRRGPVELPFELEYRHIYVLPTGFGTAFAFMLVFMALGGLNFNNNMALLMVFTLAVVVQLTTVLAYRNLVGLRLEAIASEPVFSGEPAVFRIYIGNTEVRPRFAIQAAIRRPQDCTDIAAHKTGELLVTQPSRRRGWLELEPFRLETRYPLGMFRAWCWFFPSARCLVYPTPARQPPPLPSSGAGYSGEAVKGDGEQIHGLREYRRGDSLKRVAWRTSARHDQLYTREMEIPREEACELSWNLLSGVDPEGRLSILTSWVLLADHHQLTYSLNLPDRVIGPAQGPDQRARCLEALALFGL